ncbi:MAG: AAA family ATPase [Candidatus Omnitrophica bacterium]|nr:AAA family ATPase [Candidatus Omnitrophota bacterium]
MKKTKSPKKMFIAATRRNDGKTTVSLGLISVLKNYYQSLGFIKPVGQRYLIENGIKVDEDAILISSLCDINDNLKNMSPIAVERGFTESYINNPRKTGLSKKIKKAFKMVSRGKDIVIIEGTGHAGVGSCFDLSNASVASLLNSKVILIASGGIGRPIDEIMLNVALFEKYNVGIAGVIINKVLNEKYKKIDSLVRKGLKANGIDVLGTMPYQKLLSSPTVGEISEELNLEFLHGRMNAHNTVNKILVGAMEPHEAWNYIDEGSLIITPGDREDMILMAMSSYLLRSKAVTSRIAGIVLTGGIMPHKRINSLIQRSGIPVLFANDDTYKVTSDIHDLVVKIKPNDTVKGQTAINMVEKYVDIELLMKRIS